MAGPGTFGLPPRRMPGSILRRQVMLHSYPSFAFGAWLRLRSYKYTQSNQIIEWVTSHSLFSNEIHCMATCSEHPD